jgi:hypothetical protein
VVVRDERRHGRSSVEQETEVEVEEEERVKRRGVDEVGSGRKGAGEQGGSDGRLVVGY